MATSFIFRLVATFSFVVMLVVNTLANVLPINNLTTGDVSQLYPSLFTPAGITFSIWSIIYLMLLGFVVYTWIRRVDPLITRLLPAFIVTCVFNVSWILAWHFLLPQLSVLLMLGLLACLTRIFLWINRQNSEDRMFKFLVSLPFTIYFAWICVATIANISALLVAYKFNGWILSPEVWTVLMMIVATALAVKVMLDFGSAVFGAVVAWALIGIFIRWQGTDYSIVVYGSIILAASVTALMLYTLRRKPN